MSANSLFGSISTTPSQNSTSSQPVDVISVTKPDLKSIPPVFFVGPQKKEKTVLFEPQFSNNTGSVVGYGDRRLSGILAQPKEDENKQETVQVPVKRVNADQVDANRGIFGSKRQAVSSPVLKEIPVNDTEKNSVRPNISTLQASKTIRVFGYPYEVATPGNWMVITYDSSTDALAALKANGTIISSNHMIGVTLENEEPVEIKNITPLENTEGIYKNRHGLGSGKVGHSAADPKNTTTTEDVSGGIISKLKDALLGW